MAEVGKATIKVELDAGDAADRLRAAAAALDGERVTVVPELLDRLEAAIGQMSAPLHEGTRCRTVGAQALDNLVVAAREVAEAMRP